MAEEARFTLRLPADLTDQLRKIAEREERSLHAQIVFFLRQSVREWERQRGEAVAA